VRAAIVQVEFQLDFVPKLYRIFDEERKFYGYVLLAKDLPVPKTRRREDNGAAGIPVHFSLP